MKQFRTTGNRALARRAEVFAACLIVLSLAALQPVSAHDEAPSANGGRPEIGFDQNLDAQAPLDLVFRDDEGRSVRLGDYFGSQPVILVPVYYECPRLCPLVLEGLARSLRPLSFTAGEEFRVVAFSIDPSEVPEQAREKKQLIAQRYDRAGAGEGWHFLTGEIDSIDPLARAIGFRYARQGALDEYAHAGGVVVLTPDGRVAQYFYGFDFAPRDLRLGLVEAAEGKIGSAIDQLLLLCYAYDPATGKYGLVIQRSLRLSALATVAALGCFLFVMFRRERRNNRLREGRPLT